MARLTIALLGPFQLALDGAPVTLDYEKVAALLAYLAVEHGTPQTREVLATLLWPDAPGSAARRSLSQALFTLRRALADADPQQPWLLAARNTLQFNPASDFALDVAEFSGLLAACDTHPHPDPLACPACAERRRQAADLYRGEFLQQLGVADSAEYENWVLMRREQFHRRALEALQQLTEFYLRRDESPAAVRLASRQLELDPWREEAHRQLMRAYLLDDQRSAALAQYETCRRLLADELGVEPSSETRALYEQIRLDKAPKPATARAAPGRPALLPANLPARLTAFVGRERELGLLAPLLADPACRLLTLTGPGGIGKTRLAIEAAARHRQAFAHGAVFVPLGGVTAVSQLAEGLAAAIGLLLQGSSDPLRQVLSYLADKQALLILDNLEQLTDDEQLTPWLRDLLDQCASLRLMATSRQPLNVPGEWVLDVPGLETTPAAGGELFQGAAALFVQSARRTQVGLALGPAEVEAVQRICELVGGTPLAIELAAAWVRVLSPAEIAQEIERDLGFLATNAPAVPERHRSIQAVFDQSWQLLSPAERAALEKLSVFRGGFGRDAAEQVAGASLGLLSGLVARSLVQRVAPGRYGLHELVRQYGQAKLRAAGTLEAICQRHLEYYWHLAQSAEPGLRGREQLAWFHQLETEHGNLRAALDWSLGPNVAAESGLRLAGALGQYWAVHGDWVEGRDYLERLLARPENSAASLTRAKALNGAAFLNYNLGRLAQAEQQYVAAVAISQAAGPSTLLADALRNHGNVFERLGQAARAQTLRQESLALSRTLGDDEGAAWTLLDMGSYAMSHNQTEAAHGYFQESLALHRKLNNPQGIAILQVQIGALDMAAGKLGSAQLAFEESLATSRELGDRRGVAAALGCLGQLAALRGDFAEAEALLEQGLPLWRNLGVSNPASLLHLGLVHDARGHREAAAELIAAGARLAEETGHNPFLSYARYCQALVLSRQGRLAEAMQLAQEAAAICRRTDDAWQYVDALRLQGTLAVWLGDAPAGAALLREALGQYRGMRRRIEQEGCVRRLAPLEPDPARAACLLGAAEALREALGVVMAPVDHIDYEAQVADLRARLFAADFERAWAEGRAAEWEQVVASVLMSDVMSH